MMTIKSKLLFSLIFIALYGCNDNTSKTSAAQPNVDPVTQPIENANQTPTEQPNVDPVTQPIVNDNRTLAEKLNFDPEEQASVNDIHTSVFISALDLTGINASDIESISYNIKTKDGNYAKPVSVTYNGSYLSSNGLYDTTNGIVQIPIFGLYSDYANELTLKINFIDDSSYSFQKNITTAAYVDSAGVYDNASIDIKPNATPSYSYFYLKSRLKSPIIMDIDGEIRWDVDAKKDSFASTFVNNTFMIGRTAANPDGATIDTLSLYGKTGLLDINGTNMGSDAFFHHNIDLGKTGMLVELDGTTDGKFKVESYLSEIDAQGKVIKEWDLGKIFSDYMLQEGDDPSNFVRDGIDWFHMNAATYDPSDDTLLVSSRENFVVKLDYNTGKIIWLFGDETKYWATYPSLLKLSLHLSTGQVPIGQHALSFTSAGQLMLFNNGQSSFNNPLDTPAGTALATSQTAIFDIDSQNKTAQMVWNFDDGIYSDICSSIYEDKLSAQGDFLINYAAADDRTRVIIQGINKEKQKLFEFSYPSAPCAVSWNAVQIPLENIVFK